MGEEAKPKVKIVRIFETVAFDVQKGTYRAVDIRVEVNGHFADILIPKDEYDPSKVQDYVKEWWERQGRWIGAEISP